MWERDAFCVQETRWKGNKAMSTGGGSKLLHYDVDGKKNGVEVILEK